MFHQNMIGSEINILGENVTSELNRKRKKRSVFLESAMDEFQGSKITKVAPAPTQFLNQSVEAFDKDGQSQNGIIYETLKPVYMIMKLLGVFPISKTESGVFKVTPHLLGYSVIVFLLLIGYIIYVKFDSVEIVRSQEGRFEEAVIDYLFTVYLVPVVINPILWYEGRKLAQVVTGWVYFERIYNNVTKKKMSIFSGNKPLIITIILPLISCASMVITHVSMVHFRIVQIVPYCYINTVIYMVGGFWYMQCDVVGKVATLVADDFQMALRHIGPSSSVADYRALWMLLSKLIRDIGNAFGYTLTFICLYLFLIITLTIYGLLSQLQAGFSNKDIGLTVNAALAIAILFFICDEAHYASNCVRVQFQKKLLLVELIWMNDDVQQEINMFLRATEMSPTDMSLVGFFDVNRNLFKSLLATMVTYLVVLLQFQISIPEDSGDDTNSTVIISTATQSSK